VTPRTLVRINETRHMRRWYSVSVGPTLLEPHAVLVGWGRLGSWDRWRALPAGSREEAEARAERLVRGKLRKGYKEVRDA
jgi:predicted DNA-binding WGR domain protein